MQTFQVSSPNVCGLVINGDANFVTTYLDDTTSKCHTNDASTFEQFTTTAAAKTRALAVHPTFNLATMFGTVALTEVNVSNRDLQTFEGTSLTINAEHSLSGQSVSYQWKKVTSAYSADISYVSGIPPEVEVGLTIPGAVNSSLTIANPVLTMSGLYCCVVTATAADGKVGRAFPFFNVTVHDVL